MKTNSFLLLAGSLLLGANLSPAQTVTNRPRPVISVTAPDPQAAEPAERGVFRVYRDGPTNDAVLVFCSLAGTAANGVDYQAITNVIPLRAGVRVAELPVIPIDDALVEGAESVILRLLPPPATNLAYLVGAPRTAIVSLADNDRPAVTNQPPVVRLVQPTHGASFPTGANLLLVADARDPDGTVVSVDFLAGTNRVGHGSLDPLPLPPTAPFVLVWSNVPAGEHILRALATDNRGAQTYSAPVRIVVPPVQTTVTIRAADALATEPGLAGGDLDPAVFVVARDRGTNLDLPVVLALRGTARNGVDYTALPARVVIPRGAFSTKIVLRPVADNLPEGPESVVIGIAPSPACLRAVWPPPAECYRIGEPALAEARIVDAAAANRPPAVVLLKPDEGIVIPRGQALGLLANTWDVDGYVTRVEFFAGTNKVGEIARDYFTPPPPGLHVAFQYIWSNAPLGRHELLALATDNAGASTRSLVKRIAVVTNPPPPPPTHALPVVNLVALDGLAAEGTNCWRWPGLGLCPNCPRTNCGPNVAVFAVRRSGPTNDALRVPYRIAGTASNGVDYRELSGVVAVPAGERVARIVVLPVDDLIRERIETVDLGLIIPPTDPIIPPPYLVGPQRRAAAIIVDNDAERPPSILLADGLFHLTVGASDGTWLRVEASADLQGWTELGTCEVTDGALHFVDPESQAVGHRFYRVAPALPPDRE